MTVRILRLSEDTNAAPARNGDGDINNRADATNNFETMLKNCMNTNNPNATTNCTVNFLKNKDVVQKIDDASESSVPPQSLELSSDVIGQQKPTSETLDMFAPENLRVSQDFVEQADVETVHGFIAVRKPGKQEFFRVRAGKEWQLPIAVIENNEDRELWAVVPELVESVSKEVSFVLLRLAVNRRRVPFLWALKLSRDGKSNTWNRSAMAAAETATTRWIRMQSDLSKSAYSVTGAKAYQAEPEWPDLTFQEILKIAFKERIITSYDHPFLKQLRGEV